VNAQRGEQAAPTHLFLADIGERSKLRRQAQLEAGRADQLPPLPPPDASGP
jgi:hypothetical protein